MTMPLEGTHHVAARGDGWIDFWPRLGLQLDARTNRRRHATRHVARLMTLFVLDVIGVVLAMAVMVLIDPVDGWGHVVRWNDPAAGAVSVLAQQLVAVCSGLLLMNAYAEGDAVTDGSRVTLGVALGLLVLHWPMLWRDGSGFFISFIRSVAVYASAVWLVRRVSDESLRVVWPRVIEPARALLVGTEAEVEGVMQRCTLKGMNALIPVAQLDLTRAVGAEGADGATGGRNGTSEYEALESRLQAAIHEHGVDTTLLCSQFDDDELSQIVGTSESAGCRVIALSRTYSTSQRGPTLKTYGHTPIVELTQPGIRGRDLVLKRAFDLVAASVMLVVFAPIMLVVALLVKRSSTGPALFKQERVGYGGRTFRILKFRTMCADAEEQLEALRNESIYEDARLFKVVHDPRVTTLGHFLRRSSLDELPQLFNVIAGSMSLVGPRPPLPREVAMYGDRSFLRFDVKPGITGPWQVNGRNRITSFDEVIALEAAYVSGWTIWRDFAILARTVPVVLRMDGAH